VIRRLALTAVLACRCSPCAAPVPVLTVCEALHNLSKYRGQALVLVGLAGWTFEGSLIVQNCPTEADKAAVGIIVTRYDESGPLPITFAQYRTILAKKLSEVQTTTRRETPSKALSSAQERWAALYGKLESPLVFRPPRRTARGSQPGNGFGANGSVPARLILSSRGEYDFDAEPK
jgi:hypothetical protein